MDPEILRKMADIVDYLSDHASPANMARVGALLRRIANLPDSEREALSAEFSGDSRVTDVWLRSLGASLSQGDSHQQVLL